MEQSFHIHLDFPEANPETKFKAASLLGGEGNLNSKEVGQGKKTASKGLSVGN